MIALLFAGQGAQYAGMGKAFSDSSETARNLFAQANSILAYDLAQICLNGPDEELTRTEHAQPGIYLTSWIAWQLLLERVPGLDWQAAAGLSLGEFTALAVAGAFNFEDGLKIVRARGQFMQEACEETPGGMAALLGLSEADARKICEESGVEIANLNCPGQIVVSGKKPAIQEACDLARARGARRVVPLPVAGAYHSSLMASAQIKLRKLLQEMKNKAIHRPDSMVMSNVTAGAYRSQDEVVELLARQVTATVRWEESMRALISEGCKVFIELGPGTALSNFLKRIERGVRVYNIEDMASLETAANGLRALLAAPDTESLTSPAGGRANHQ